MEIKINKQTFIKLALPVNALKIIFAVFVGSAGVWAQENEAQTNKPLGNTFHNYQKLPPGFYFDPGGAAAADNTTTPESAGGSSGISSGSIFDRKKLSFLIAEEKFKSWIEPKETEETDGKGFPDGKRSVQNGDAEKFHWKPALIQSGFFLGFQHGFRLAAQKGTRARLGGPFFRDWAQSVKNLRGWRDGNNFAINYIGHPLQGGLTGRIFINNSDRAKKQEFGKSKKYWETRLKALAWSTFWSTQFELGPISEANIGNVGLFPVGKYSSMSYVDLVVTPVLGTGVVVGEDAIDKYILKNWLERKGKSRTKQKIFRSLLTPTTSIGNILRGKVPWKRDNRPL